MVGRFSLYRLCEWCLSVFLRVTAPMETRISRFSKIAFGILFLFTCFSSKTEATFKLKSFQQKIVALNKVLNYINNRPQQMNIDTIFGVTLCEANLMTALLHENVQYLNNTFFTALNEVTTLSDLTRRNLMNIVTPKNKTEHFLQSTLNDPIIWIKPLMWTKLFPKVKLIPSQKLNYFKVIKSMWYGAPNETESNECLVKIAYSGSNKKCQIPETCIEILIRNDGTAGYPLTHRLLIIQIARMFGCQEIKSARFSHLIPAYCAKILQNLIDLEAWNFPIVAKDLMIEQIVLCGMEGYYEFIDKHYEDLILSWPHSSGCFGFQKFGEEHKIIRRSSSQTDFGCENHTTGLAAAALALFIRENIENACIQKMQSEIV